MKEVKIKGGWRELGSTALGWRETAERRREGRWQHIWGERGPVKADKDERIHSKNYLFP